MKEKCQNRFFICDYFLLSSVRINGMTIFICVTVTMAGISTLGTSLANWLVIIWYLFVCFDRFWLCFVWYELNDFAPFVIWFVQTVIFFLPCGFYTLCILTVRKLPESCSRIRSGCPSRGIQRFHPFLSDILPHSPLKCSYRQLWSSIISFSNLYYLKQFWI